MFPQLWFKRAQGCASLFWSNIRLASPSRIGAHTSHPICLKNLLIRMSTYNPSEYFRHLFWSQHPEYDSQSPGVPNDIAIIRLAEAVDLSNQYVGVIGLPEANEDFVGNSNCWIMGWGLTGEWTSYIQNECFIAMTLQLGVTTWVLWIAHPVHDSSSYLYDCMHSLSSEPNRMHTLHIEIYFFQWHLFPKKNLIKAGHLNY